MWRTYYYNKMAHLPLIDFEVRNPYTYVCALGQEYRNDLWNMIEQLVEESDSTYCYVNLETQSAEQRATDDLIQSLADPDLYLPQWMIEFYTGIIWRPLFLKAVYINLYSLYRPQGSRELDLLRLHYLTVIDQHLYPVVWKLWVSQYSTKRRLDQAAVIKARERKMKLLTLYHRTRPDLV